jgi:hypothetical protein
VYSLYVIEISDERGPRLNPKYPNVYVGQTVLTPEARFAQHRAGYKASRYLWKGGKGRGQWLGLWLKRRLYGRYNPIETRAEAERLEAWLAEHLRHKVWGAQSPSSSMSNSQEVTEQRKARTGYDLRPS